MPDPAATKPNRSVTIEPGLSSRDNNFFMMRLVAAIVVIFNHSFDLVGSTSLLAPVDGFLGRTLAVDVFIISGGLLLVPSFQRRPRPWQFMYNRALRIYPALFVTVVGFALFVAPWLTTLSVGEYFSHGQTWRHIFKQISVVMREHELPGVFTDNVNTSVNGALWTLRVLLFYYVFVSITGALRMLEPGWRSAIGLGGSVVISGLLVSGYVPKFWPGALDQTIQYAPTFTAAMLISVYRKWIPQAWWLALAALLLVLLLSPVGWGQALAAGGAVYVMTYVGCLKIGWIRWFDRLPEISLGLYVYAFPVQQAAIDLFPEAGAITNFLIAFPITVVLAWLSMRLIEVPLIKRLSLKNKPAAVKPKTTSPPSEAVPHA